MCDNRCRHFRGVYSARGYEVAGAATEGVEAVAGWKKWVTLGSGDGPGKEIGILYVALVYVGERDVQNRGDIRISNLTTKHFPRACTQLLTDLSFVYIAVLPSYPRMTFNRRLLGSFPSRDAV